MKTRVIFIFGLVAVIVADTAYAAQSREDRLKQLFDRTDTDQDGLVSSLENWSEWQRFFFEKDDNNDRFLDRDEVVNESHLFADSNGDGKVDLSEEKVFRQMHFNTKDLDGDGFLSLAELTGLSQQPVEPFDSKHSGSYDVMRAKVEALGDMVQRPMAYRDGSYENTEHMQAIYIDGLTYEGKPTKFFGWLGIPENLTKPAPGIILVHGGGGTAYKEWVQKWNDQGFIAFSIAVEGQTDVFVEAQASQGSWERHQWAGPSRNGIYGDSDRAIEDQWMYHAVANSILANSFLRDVPEVDPQQIGIMGISWGGVIASTVIGIDDRFAFAIPTYGCGGLARADNQYGRTLSRNPIYKEVWEPNLRLEQVLFPTLWLSWPGDQHFPMDSLKSSYRAVSAPAAVSLIPDMQHSHPAAWKRPEAYAFARSVVSGNDTWGRNLNIRLVDGVVKASFKTDKPIQSATLVWTQGDGFTAGRTWLEAPAEFQNKNSACAVSVKLPAGATAAYINIESDGLVMSSPYLEI